ncbi:hypothetical protein [Sinomicrobium sp. M5D2P17]
MNRSAISTLFCTLVFFNIANPQEQGWKMARNEKGIIISYRWVPAPEGRKAREMKAVFTVDSNVNSVISQFRDGRKFRQWSVTASNCDIQLKNDKLWEAHIELRFPWPLRSRDLVTRNELITSGNTIILKMNSIPKARPELPGTKRIESYLATWQFSGISGGKTMIIHRVITYDPPEFPRILADPVIQDKFIESVERLRLQI